MRRTFVYVMLAGWSLGLAACGATSGPSGPAPLEEPPTTPSPVAEVTFHLSVNVASPPGAAISLLLLDEVSGIGNNTIELPLKIEADGTWTTRLTPPVGSVLRYRYQRQGPTISEEWTALGEPAHYRMAVVTGSMSVNDVLAAWAGEPFAGTPGRIIGVITDASTEGPLRDVLVTAGGLASFTDGQGAFRLDGLPAGLHTLAVLSPTGAHLPVQQGAVVASESATPASLALTPSQPVQVSFEVTVPSDTPPGSVMRLIGNTRVLGDSFALLPGGQSVDIARGLPLVMVDSTHYLALATMYPGTDLRYKYSLGDGLWNAERDEEGALRTRQLVIPAHDLVVTDVVSTWHAAEGSSIPFFVTAPPGTPASDAVSLELSASGWASPLPMWPLGNGQWTYTLHGPTASDLALHYRYCRNQQCNEADDADTSGPQAEGRPLNPSSPPADTITAWSWWDPAAGGATVVAPEILVRPGFEAGYEILTPFNPTWSSHFGMGLAEMAAGGANAVVLTPAWTVGPISTTPRLAFDPARAPFVGDLLRQAEEGRDLGLAVAIHPRLIEPSGAIDLWWVGSPRDSAWWTVWFDEYRSFAVGYAQAAEAAGATKLILGGTEVVPALPGGVLSDGTPSGVPGDAETRWRSLLDNIRAVYHGRLAWEMDFGAALRGKPSFLDAVDDLHIAWHAPLGQDDDLTSDAMQAEAYRLLDTLLLNESSLQGRPLFLSVEYLSVNGGATGCAPAPDGSCRPPSSFDSGAVVDPDLPVDLAEQSAAINAVLLAAYGRETIHGFYVAGFHPAVALQDKSTSIRGKPAQQMLGYWYPRLTGR